MVFHIDLQSMLTLIQGQKPAGHSVEQNGEEEDGDPEGGEAYSSLPPQATWILDAVVEKRVTGSGNILWQVSQREKVELCRVFKFRAT